MMVCDVPVTFEVAGAFFVVLGFFTGMGLIVAAEWLRKYLP